MLAGWLALALMVVAGGFVDAQKAIDVAGVRLDEAFRLAGSNSTGLVVSVTVNDLKPHTTSDNFLVRLFDEKGGRPEISRVSRSDRSRTPPEPNVAVAFAATVLGCC